MFAITGITGQVGSVVASTLIEAGLPVRAVVRSTAKGAPWKDRGCEIAVAEMADATALTAAFAGAEGVFLLLPPVFDPQPGFPEARASIASMVEAVKVARPKKLVALSTVGAQAPQLNILNQLGLMEQALGELDLPVAFLRAAWFMENAEWDVADARAGRIGSFLQPLDRRVPMIATHDVGRTAADLLREEWSGRRIVELFHAEVSPRDIAGSFARALARDVEVEALPRASWEERFRAQGMSNPEPRMRMLDGFNEGWIAFEDGAYERRQGSVTLDTVIGALVSRGQ